MKFPKGKSGNPGGRPKVLGEVQELARQYAPTALVELARLALKAKSETARIAAIRELLDRGYGRSRQAMEISAPAGDPQLRLDRLSRIEVERYLALRFGDDALASTLSGPVFERTQGQPLFMASLLKYFIDQRVIVETDGAWRLSSETAIAQEGVPNDLVNMITYQVARLTEDERRLLDIASVAGGEFSAALVAAGPVT